MSIEKWSANIWVADLQDDPGFTDDLTTLNDQLETSTDVNVVLRFKAVDYLNSSNIARLLKLRKRLQQNKKRLLLCEMNTNVWGVFLVTGLDKVFEFADDLGMALAGLQLEC